MRPLIAEFTATFGVGWSAVTEWKHRDDFERFLAWTLGRWRRSST